MNTYLNTLFIAFFILISCGGSKSDLSDSYLSGSVKQNVNSNPGNNPLNQSPTYSFGNELIWSDEFGEDSSSGILAVSSDKWNIETVAPNNGSWYNGELQYYTDKQDNIKIENGFLKITAKREEFQGKQFTSARINTQDKLEFTYGRVEMRAKLPNWEGMWPAFWMLGANIDEVSWPNCGELDILEHDKIQFFVDEEMYFEYPMQTQHSPFDKPFFLLLNLAVGGHWTDGYVDPGFTNATYEIDYVRVYQ